MVIDFHTHLFPDELADKAFAVLSDKVKHIITPYSGVKARELLDSMEQNGVDISVVQPVVTKETQTRKTNAWAAGLSSDKLIPFGGLYPHSADYKEHIDEVVSLGMKGIKLHPEYQDFTVDAPEMLRVYDYILGRGLILLIHAGLDLGMPPPYKSNPKMFADVARQMKGGVIVAAHLGGHAQWDDAERYLAGENIYLDTSMGFEYYSDEQFVRIVKAHGTDKVLFATDSPWGSAKFQLEHIKKLPLSDEDKEAILCGNAKRLLKL